MFHLSDFGGPYENINLKSMVCLQGLFMEKANLIHIPGDLRYVAASIHILNFRNNWISTLYNMYNISFPVLKEVRLEFNNIFHFEHNLLRFPTLQIFSIRHNKIRELPDMSTCVWGMESEDMMYATFHPANNPFHCNGSMMWLGKSICRHGEAIYFRHKVNSLSESTTSTVDVVDSDREFTLWQHCRSPRASSDTSWRV